MNSASYDDIFARASLGDSHYVEVAMDTAEIVILQEDQSGAIATRRLGGCSGVVVLGRTAAIMAHIAPLPPTHRNGQGLGTTSEGLAGSEQHFVQILRRVEQLYTNNTAHFPARSTVWGFYIAGFESVTDNLRAIAIRRFAALGLSTQHAYYDANLAADRGDRVRTGVRINGQGTTSFYVENRQMESVRFPEALPDRHASRTLASNNFLVFIGTNSPSSQLQQRISNRMITPERSRLTGVYDVLCIGQDRRAAWMKFDFDAGAWL